MIPRAEMRARDSMRFAHAFLPALLTLLLCSATARAADETAAPSSDALYNLGQQFAERIGNRLEQADAMLAGANKLEIKELQSGNKIPEGEPLLMRALLGKTHIRLDGDILTMRRNDKLMVSLADIATVLELPITSGASGATATGWFRSESNIFSLDANKKTVSLGGVPIPCEPDDITVDNGDIMVSTGLLQKIFGLKIDFDLSSLSMLIMTDTPLPIEAKAMRAKEQKYKPGYGSDAPTLPLVNQPYQAFSKPYFDVSAGANIARANGNSPTRDSANWSVISAEDLLGFSSRTFASGFRNNQGTGEALGTLRQTFTREDPDGKMLGPLGVRTLEFGDVDTVNLPLVGGGQQEQGIHLSSQLPGAVTTLSHMDIKGDAQPGWDVELYNNDSLLGMQTVGDDGQYDFQNVFLFEGDNIMRIVFYGPQGQTREETRRIVSSASTLQAGQGAWETSLSRTNKTTYNAEQASQPNDGDAHLVARYEYSFGPEASAHAGFARESETDGVIARDKNFLQAGGAANFLGALLTADVAYDTDGPYMTDLLARRSFGFHQAALEWSHASNNFTQGALNAFAPINAVTGDLRGPIADSFMGLKHVNYTATSEYSENQDGSTSLLSTGTVSAYHGTYGLSQGLSYDLSKAAGAGASKGSWSGLTTFSGYAGKGRWRLTSNYGVAPYSLETMAANYTYDTSPSLEWIGDVTRASNTGVTEFALSARWRPDKVSVTPRVAFDTNHQMSLGVNLNFGTAENPYEGKYAMFNRTITTTGGVAGRVFLDKNGDGIYDAGDELLPDVDVRSLQASGIARTDKQGVAFLPTLQESLRTDVVVTPESLPDPYDITATAGYSVRPRPGVTTRLDFPVVVGGEMDGTVSFDGATGARIHGVTIKLVAPDGRVEKSAVVGTDGYYSISTIHPGVYYLVAQALGGDNAGTFKPKMLVFQPSGSTFFGENIEMSGGTDTGFIFRAVNPPPNAGHPERVIRQDDIESQELRIHVGEYHSRIALMLGWYRYRMMSGLSDAFVPDKDIDDVAPDPRTGIMTIVLRPTRGVTMAEALDACHALASNAYKCSIELATKWRKPQPIPVTPAAPVQQAHGARAPMQDVSPAHAEPQPPPT